ARRKTEPFGIVARHRHLHHFDRTAGEPERHPHERASARPSDQIVGRSYQEAFVGKFGTHAGEKGVVRPNRLAGARIENSSWRGCDNAHGLINPIPAPPSSTHI